MQAIEVTAKGFGPFQEEMTLQLAERGLVLLEGRNHDSTSARSNGAGKTAVIKAVTWCLFGKFPDGDDDAVRVIHRRAKKAEVMTTWLDEDSDTGYCITRIQTKSGQQLRLEMTAGGELVPINGEGKKETQAKVEAILGLDYSTWCNTVLFAAGGLTRFASRGTDDSDRKAMLKQIYGLGVIDVARKLVAKEASGFRQRVEEADKAVLRRRAQIDTVSLNDLEAKRAAAEREREREVAGYEAQARELEGKELALAPDKELLSSTKKLLTELRPKLDAAIEVHREAAAEVQGASDELHDDPVAAERKQLAADTSELRSKQQELQRLRGDRCPFCTTPLNQPGIAHDHREALVAAEARLQGSVARLTAAVGANDELTRKARAEIKVRLEQVRRLEVEVSSLQQQIRAAERRVAELEAPARTPFAALIATARGRAEAARAKPNVYVAMIEEASERVGRWRVQLEEELRTLDAARADLAYCDFWNEAFSDRGLISFVIDQMLPTLNRRLNEKLQVLSDGDMMVMFDSETTIKSGETRGKIGMRSMIEGIDNATPSTAQDRKICVAGALAMMDVVAQRAGKRIDLQMLDEPFDGLDDVGKERLVQLLKDQQATKGTILVTTHDAWAAGAFTKRILVERRSGAARIIEEE